MLINRVRPGLARARARAIEEEDERYNPIRPSNGNISMKGGANMMANVKSSRNPRLSLADRRAMEIQHRHETPGTGATPTMGVSQFRGGGFMGADGHGVRNMVGSGATPSRGLSQFRGGATVKDKQKKHLVGVSNYVLSRGRSKKDKSNIVDAIKKGLEYILSNMVEDTDGSVAKKVKGLMEGCSGADAVNNTKGLVKEFSKIVDGLDKTSVAPKLSAEHIKHLEGVNDDIMMVPGEGKTASIKVIGLVKKALTYALKHLEGDAEVAETIKKMIKSCPTGVALKKMPTSDVLDLSRDVVNEFDDLLSDLGGTSYGGGRYRGGANENLLLNMTNVARSGPYEGQGRMKAMPPAHLRAGGKHHRDGHALSAHLMKTLGKANHRRLMGGMMAHCEDCHGGAWYDFLDPNKNGVGNAFNKVKNEFVNPDSVLRRGVADAAQKTGHEFTDPNSILRGQVLPEAAKYASYAAPVLDVAGTAVGLPGAGTMLSRGLSAAQYANQGAKALGYGRNGKKRRAPASASDGRRKRAEIVRKVMNERGVKMIEASKIVKSEGLY